MDRRVQKRAEMHLRSGIGVSRSIASSAAKSSGEKREVDPCNGRYTSSGQRSEPYCTSRRNERTGSIGSVIVRAEAPPSAISEPGQQKRAKHESDRRGGDILR